MANTTHLNLVPVDGDSKLKNFPTPYNGNLDKIDAMAGRVRTIGYAVLSSSSPVEFEFSSGYGIVILVAMWQGHGGNIFAARVTNNVLSVKSLFTGEEYTGSNPAFSYNATTHKVTISQTAPSTTGITYIKH